MGLVYVSRVSYSYLPDTSPIYCKKSNLRCSPTGKCISVSHCEDYQFTNSATFDLKNIASLIEFESLNSTVEETQVIRTISCNTNVRHNKNSVTKISLKHACKLPSQNNKKDGNVDEQPNFQVNSIHTPWCIDKRKESESMSLPARTSPPVLPSGIFC